MKFEINTPSSLWSVTLGTKSNCPSRCARMEMQIVIGLPAGTTVCSRPFSPCVDTFSIVIEPSLGHRTMGTRFAAVLGASSADATVAEEPRLISPPFGGGDSDNSQSFPFVCEAGGDFLQVTRY